MATVVNSWFEYHRRRNLGENVVHVSQTTTATAPSVPANRVFESDPEDRRYVAPPTTPLQQGASMPLDLGGLFQTAAEAYISRELAPTPVSYAPANIGVVPDIIERQFDPSLGGTIDPRTGQPKCKRRRRRRKRLATASDIRDIASLKGAFGVKGSQPGAFETWIATHS